MVRPAEREMYKAGYKSQRKRGGRERERAKERERKKEKNGMS